jgi:Transglutaminase-like superfamily
MTARLPFFRRVAGLARMPLERQALLVEAAIHLGVSRVLLKTMPFPRLAKRWGAFVPPSDPRAGSGLVNTSDDRAATARKVGDAVRRAARNVPFGAVCLPQAMAARRMLARRSIPSVMHFGAAKGQDKPIDAHAWLDAAGIKVTGYPVANGFVEMGCFVGGQVPPEA